MGALATVKTPLTVVFVTAVTSTRSPATRPWVADVVMVTTLVARATVVIVRLTLLANATTGDAVVPLPLQSKIPRPCRAVAVSMKPERLVRAVSSWSLSTADASMGTM